MLKWFRATTRRTAAIWWIVIVSSIVVFVVGFSVAPSLIGSGPVAETVQVGSVEGRPVTYGEYQQAIQQTNDAYEQQSGQEVGRREAPILEEQAWAQIVTERALAVEAKRIGYGTNDRELIFTIQTSPPPWVRTHPAFQTDGRFDPIKYGQALADPGNDWKGLEEQVRRILPAQKLEEMLLASSRFSEPQLRRAFAEQNERIQVSLALWTPPPGLPDTAALAEAEVRAFYDEHPELFSGPAQVKAEVVSIPKTVSAEDEGGALKTAQSLVEQARSGADFEQLARDMSEGQLAERGGYMGLVPLSQVPAIVQGPLQALGDSGITDPIRETSRFFVFKARREPGTAEPSYHLWQIGIPIAASEASRQRDFETIQKLRREAERAGLGPAAAKMGIVSQATGWFAENGFDPLLMSLPQAQQYASQAAKGAVSVAYDVESAWALIQTTDRREAGVYPYETVKDEVKVALARERSLAPAFEAAQRAKSAIEAGADFAKAVTEAGASQTRETALFTRTAPDGLLGGAPRAVGLAFGLAVGQVGGPVRTPLGVYLVRKSAEAPVTDEAYEAGKGNVSQSLLSQSQQQHFGAWIAWYREKARVRDKRAEVLVAR